MAEGDDDAQKTEEPTPKKLEETRKKGQVPLSREMNNWVMLLAGTIVIVAMGSSMMGGIADILKSVFDNSYQLHGPSGGIGKVLSELFSAVGMQMGLPILFLLLAAFLGPFVQIGPLLSPESIKPSLSKISPIAGFGRLFSMRSLFEFFKGLLKISIVGSVSFILLSPFYDTIDHYVGLPIPYMLDQLKALFFRLMTGVLVVLFILAVVDIVYQRMEHKKKIMMSRQDIKDEFKQTEGDPQMRARLRQLRMEKAQQRMIQSVPEADVVITNPTHFAIALKYDPKTMDAPVCLAKGTDEVAQRIKEVANDNKVTLVENKPLARAMYDMVEIGETIPEEHYKAVAEVISYVFKLKGKM
ncbi:MAG: flagellar biosynthesis protein FlhB [Alphaproteobacteria bacterium]|nr:MAG: flagellar biosynthesis protein FlhB [Alphaproteobacteria bacterium]